MTDSREEPRDTRPHTSRSPGDVQRGRRSVSGFQSGEVGGNVGQPDDMSHRRGSGTLPTRRRSPPNPVLCCLLSPRKCQAPKYADGAVKALVCFTSSSPPRLTFPFRVEEPNITRRNGKRERLAQPYLQLCQRWGWGGVSAGVTWYQGRAALPVLLSHADVQNDERARRQSQLVIS